MKLTARMLKQIIAEEVSKFGNVESTEDRAEDTEELDADEIGSEKALAHKIDYVKALKLEETRLLQRLKKISETRKRILKTL